ncbi:MAG: hypothetical protein FWB90_01185 [Fibromonadales bacterium]|nr:hypothetical protein [Fibromonadales bacterium]
MKKILLGILFFAVFASSTATQKSVLGNWSLAKPQTPDPSARIILEKDTLKLTEDWKYTETAIYKISSPEYTLKVSMDGEYRLEKDALKKYLKNYTAEIKEESASDEEAAQKSLAEIERLIKAEVRKPFPILSVTETEFELQGINGNLDFKFTKPKRLPVSKLTRDSVPFFAPEGWRFPEDAKELSNFSIRLKESKNLLTYVKADFNGDGQIDAAAYLMNQEMGQVALFINMSQPDGSYDLKPYGSADRNPIIENGLMLATAGEHMTNTKQKEKVVIEHPGFIEVIFGTTAYLMYWDSKSKDWVKVQLGKKL